MRELVLSLPGILDCHDITSRGIPGRMIFIEMHMVVEPLDVESAHRLTEAVEHLLQERSGAGHHPPGAALKDLYNPGQKQTFARG